MNRSRWPRVIALLVLCLLSSAALAQEPDGLVRVKSRQMEMAWLRPGADFRPYTKVIIDRTSVAFQPNWMKDYNLNANAGAWVTQEDANKIMNVARPEPAAISCGCRSDSRICNTGMPSKSASTST